MDSNVRNNTDNKTGTGTWQRYKLGQAQFTRWLKQTADKLAPAKTAATDPSVNVNVNENASASASASVTAEPPARARKKKNKTKEFTSTNDEQRAVMTHWRDLQLMADTIVEKARPEDIPSAPINILRGVVDLRKKSARFFERAAASNASDERLKEGNATHRHIIKVLELILDKFDALLAKASPGIKSKPKTPPSRINVHDLANMFECLEVHAPHPEAGAAETDDDEETPDTQSQASYASKRRPLKSGKKKARRKTNMANTRREARRPTPREASAETASWIDTVDFGLEGEDEYADGEFDYYMVVYCFFEDFNAIRSHICELWCDYFYDRSVPLETLAVLTNAAFELFQQLDRDLVATLSSVSPLIARYDVMFNLLFIEHGMEHIDYDAYEEASPEEEERMWKDEADWLAAPVFFSVENILAHVPPGKVPMLRAADRAVYGATRARDLDDFKSAVVFELLYEVAILKALKTNGQVGPVLPAESALLLAFQRSLRTYTYSSSFIFSLQLFVDVRYILEENVTHAFEGLQEMALSASQTLLDHRRKATGVRREIRRPMDALLEDIQCFVLQDITLEDKKLRFEKMGIFDEDPEPFCLLKRDPVWAGLLAFRCRLQMSKIGQAYAAPGCLVEAAVYLYSAARAASGDVRRWREMEKWLALYGDDSALKRGLVQAENDPVEMLRSFENTLDLLVADRATPAGVEGQKFRWAAETRDGLWRRYGNERKQDPYFMENLQSVVRHRLGAKRLEGDGATAFHQESGGNSGPTGSSDKAILKREPGHLELDDTPERDLVQRRAMLAQLSPIELLRELEETVTTQLKTVLDIDYFALYDESVALLEAVAMCLDDEFQARVGWEEGKTEPDLLARVPVALGQILKGDGGSGDASVLESVCRCIDLQLAKSVETDGSQDHSS